MDRNQAKEFFPIMQAFAEGRVIECRTKPSAVKGTYIPNYWTEMKEIEFWNNTEHRVKPEQKCRPFKDAKECMAEMLKHHPFGFITSQCAFFHVIYIEDKLIGYGSACGAILHTKFNDALESFTFVDGVPFGVKVEE